MIHFNIETEAHNTFKMEKVYWLQIVTVRVTLFVFFMLLEAHIPLPFNRIVHPSESYLYGHPQTKDYFPSKYCWMMVVFLPIFCVVSVHVLTGQKRDWRAEDTKSAVLCLTLLIPLTGVITDLIKVTVGRPRPDFFYRCWPDRGYPNNEEVFSINNEGSQDLECTGDVEPIIQGRKSFPSGHSSLTFATFGFIFFYLSGKMHTFSADRKVDEKAVLISITCLIGMQFCYYYTIDAIIIKAEISI